MTRAAKFPRRISVSAVACLTVAADHFPQRSPAALSAMGRAVSMIRGPRMQHHARTAADWLVR
jgi:hypothetical protein